MFFVKIGKILGHCFSKKVLVFFVYVGFVANTSALSCELFRSTFVLKPTMVNNNVVTIQKVLNLTNDTRVAISGPGSLGNETSKYGASTVEAIKKFQQKYSDEILAPRGLMIPTGRFGLGTRKKMLEICEKSIGLTQSSVAQSEASSLNTVPTFIKNKPSLKVFSPSFGTAFAKGSVITMMLKASSVDVQKTTIDIIVDNRVVETITPDASGGATFVWNTLLYRDGLYNLGFSLYSREKSLLATTTIAVTLGKNGGEPAASLPSLLAIRGICGTSQNVPTASTPQSLCSGGTSSSLSSNGVWSWMCLGNYDGSSVYCSAPLLQAASVPPTPAPVPSPLPLPAKVFVTASDFNGSLRGVVINNRPDPAQAEGDQYYADFVSKGANLARAWINVKKEQVSKESFRYYVDETEYGNIDKLLAMAKKHNFKLVLTVDLAEAVRISSTTNGIFWQDGATQDNFALFWKDVAAKYQADTSLAGYDILNEPALALPSPEANNVWETVAKKVMTKVREVDTNHVIIIEPAYGLSASSIEYDSWNSLTPINPEDNKIVYSLHFYAPMEFTHQGIYGFPLGLTYPTGLIAPFPYFGEVFNLSWLRRTIDPVIQWQGRYHLPIYIGEFSAIRYAPGDSRENYLRDLFTIFKENNWSWTYHAWRSWLGWDAEINSHEVSESVPRDGSGPVIDLLEKNLKGL